jgi:hypothetical protein
MPPESLLPGNAAASGHRIEVDPLARIALRCLSKLARDRLEGVRSDLVRAVERAIQITTQDFRVQERGLRRAVATRQPAQPQSGKALPEDRTSSHRGRSS